MTQFDEAHQLRFLAHYERIKDADQSEAWKVRTAESFASNRGLDVLIEPTRPSSRPYPFEPGDYVEDKKPPMRAAG